MGKARGWLSKLRRAAKAKEPRTAAEMLVEADGQEIMSLASLALERLVLERFYDPEVGRAFDVSAQTKAELVERFKANTTQIPSGTSWLSHVILAQEILSVPPSVRGDVIECGCWKGASTASLSLVCRLVGRKLLVSDSFEGLPEDDTGVTHQYPHINIYGYYQKGMYAGRLDEVKSNIARLGDLSVCHFVPGFFSDTLHTLSEPLVFAFLDVDLVSSMRDCLKYIWPLMVEGGAVYTDDSCDMEVVRVWFDNDWWQREVGVRAPGYVGSGCGIPLTPNFSSIGYSRKLGNVEESYNRVSWLYYPDASNQGAWFPSESSQ
jgi:O-methyltransferase